MTRNLDSIAIFKEAALYCTVSTQRQGCFTVVARLEERADRGHVLEIGAGFCCVNTFLLLLFSNTLSPPPLKKKSTELLNWSTDCPASAKITGSHVTAIDRMVSQLLFKGPVHVFKIGFANGVLSLGALG